MVNKSLCAQTPKCKIPCYIFLKLHDVKLQCSGFFWHERVTRRTRLCDQFTSNQKYCVIFRQRGRRWENYVVFVNLAGHDCTRIPFYVLHTIKIFNPYCHGNAAFERQGKTEEGGDDMEEVSVNHATASWISMYPVNTVFTDQYCAVGSWQEENKCFRDAWLVFMKTLVKHGGPMVALRDVCVFKIGRLPMSLCNYFFDRAFPVQTLLMASSQCLHRQHKYNGVKKCFTRQGRLITCSKQPCFTLLRLTRRCKEPPNLI